MGRGGRLLDRDRPGADHAHPGLDCCDRDRDDLVRASPGVVRSPSAGSQGPGENTVQTYNYTSRALITLRRPANQDQRVNDLWIFRSVLRVAIASEQGLKFGRGCWVRCAPPPWNYAPGGGHPDLPGNDGRRYSPNTFGLYCIDRSERRSSDPPTAGVVGPRP